MDAARRIIRQYERGSLVRHELFLKLMQTVADGGAAELVAWLPPGLLAEVKAHLDDCPQTEEGWAGLRWCCMGMTQRLVERFQDQRRQHRRGVEALRSYFAARPKGGQP